MARLGVLALLIHAALLGFHNPLALLAAPAAACLEQEAAQGSEHPDETNPLAPGHVRAPCPFCTLAQGGTLIPPSPFLIFPPVSRPIAIAPPTAESATVEAIVAAHRPRGPPVEA